MKRLTYGILSILLALSNPIIVPVNAATEINTTTLKESFDDNGIDVQATISNADDNFKIDIKKIEYNDIQSDNVNDTNEQTVGYEAYYSIPTDSEISLLDTGSSSNTSGGCTARLYVTYTYLSSNDTINITKVYGSWTLSSSLYYTQNRWVIVRSDSVSAGYTNKYTPASNTFNYNITWGYVPYYPSTSYSMSGANNSVDVKVQDTGGTHTITLRVAV